MKTSAGVTLYVLPPACAARKTTFEARGIRFLATDDVEGLIATVVDVVPRAVIIDETFSAEARAELRARFAAHPETALRRIVFPSAPVTEGTLSRQAGPHHHGSSKHAPRVLIVDDHVDSGELAREVLEQRGFEVSTAATAGGAIEALLDGSFDVAVVDIGLPDVDGYAVARIARVFLGALSPRLVALTGYVSPSDRERAERAGFDAHLSKPIDVDELARIVGAVAVDGRFSST